ncbi:MAG: glycosyltransferase family 4 protein [Actinobacteria bacterium]|nr:glycosyltransferase family 4 protein [Actinomycetota bacterium]
MPATHGGIERHVEEVGARLAAMGHDVTVFCRSNYVPAGSGSHRGMRLRRLPTVGTKHLDAIVHSALSTAAALPQRFDVLHYHALGPGALTPVARALGRARVVQTVHGLDHDRSKWGGGARRLLRGAAWLSARVPHATIVVSHALADHYRDRYRRTVTAIPNGVEAPSGRPAPEHIRRRLGLEGGDYLLFVGRWVPEKAPDVLLRAFLRLSGDMRLVLAGESSFTDDFSGRLRRLASGQPRVVLPGFVYGPMLAELYANAAAFVLPSTVEGLPLTLLEAASYGTPVVASAIAPHVEVLGGEGPGRRLFPPGDEDGLVAALGRSLADPPAERAGAADLRRRVVAAYRWEDAASATERLYRRLLPERAPAPAPPA